MASAKQSQNTERLQLVRESIWLQVSTVPKTVARRSQQVQHRQMAAKACGWGRCVLAHSQMPHMQTSHTNTPTTGSVDKTQQSVMCIAFSVKCVVCERTRACACASASASVPVRARLRMRGLVCLCVCVCVCSRSLGSASQKYNPTIIEYRKHQSERRSLAKPLAKA